MTHKIPQAKRRTLRFNHLKHLSEYYVLVMEYLNAALDPVVVAGDEYYLGDGCQCDVVEKARDGAADLVDAAHDLVEYLDEILDEDFPE